MAKPKKKAGRPPAAKTPAFPVSSMAPQILEQAAQGWLQSTGAARPSSASSRPPADQRLAEALTDTLQGLRAEIAELRARLDRMENR